MLWRRNFNLISQVSEVLTVQTPHRTLSIYTTIRNFSLSALTVSSFLASSSPTSQVALTYRPFSQALWPLVSHTTKPAQRSAVSVNAIMDVSDYQSRSSNLETY